MRNMRFAVNISSQFPIAELLETTAFKLVKPKLGMARFTKKCGVGDVPPWKKKKNKKIGGLLMGRLM
ncbi:hypothetical protein NDU88_001859 [Pleurodeles waltl]|uniref:Uncharacterized protein n=1 Tax=Pleurodeles waltl TaxID=8319 RepID=A0AAV7LC98_PLEWA|nr:hypothetical protein NDU88_001859 [Pleurodeles waltl]